MTPTARRAEAFAQIESRLAALEETMDGIIEDLRALVADAKARADQ